MFLNFGKLVSSILIKFHELETTGGYCAMIAKSARDYVNYLPGACHDTKMDK